jgi:hypothetical protein
MMKMTGGYLRTNWRQTQNVLNTDALVGQFGNTSMFGGSIASAGASGMARPYPMVFYSVKLDTANSLLQIGAYSIMSAYFGESLAAAMGEGHKIVPLAIMTKVLVGTGSMANIWFSLCTSDDSMINFCCRAESEVSGVSFSARFQFAGFIVSSP